MLGERRERGNLLLFEGIIIGLYGNWLFSALDKIDFERFWGTIAKGDLIPIVFFVFLLLSFAWLLLYLVFSIFRKTLFGTYLRTNLPLILHILGIFFPLELFTKVNTVETNVFLAIGVTMVIALSNCESARRRLDATLSKV